MRNKLPRVFSLGTLAALALNLVVFAPHARAASVTTCADLQAITGSGTYTLTGDIDCSGVASFTPIASFSGTLDGAGHTVSHVTHEQTGFDNNLGVFATTDGATIKNISFSNLDLVGNYVVGGLVAHATNTTIVNVSVGGTVSSSAASSIVGGLIGNMTGGTLTNSMNGASIDGVSFAGGLVAYANSAAIIRRCFSQGGVSVSDDGGTSLAGGLVGILQDGGTLLEDSYTQAGVSGSGDYVGGLVGQSNNGTIARSYFAGSMTGTGAHVGGLVGGVGTGSSSAYNSFWDTTTTGLSASEGGTGLATTALQTQSTFTDAYWDFTNVWQISPSDYPSLRSLGTATVSTPVLSSTTPADGAANVGTALGHISITFDRNVLVGTGVFDIRHVGDNAVVEVIPIWSTNITGAGTPTLTIPVTASLQRGQSYYVESSLQAIDDLYGNIYAGLSDTTTWNFSTVAAGGRTVGSSTAGVPAAPTCALTAPSAGATLPAGSVAAIRWSGSGAGYAGGLVSVSVDGGVTWQVLGSSVGGEFAWTVPASASSAKIKVDCRDGGGSMLATTVSDAFAVSGASQAAVGGSGVSTTTDAAGRRWAPPSGKTGPSPFDGATQDVSVVVPGWYVRSPSSPTVYYVTGDLHRRPFWDTRTFFTWGSSWDDVVWVTDATLPTLPLDVPMVPKAGTVLVKQPDMPQTYAVSADAAGKPTLRLVPSEAVAVALFGGNWNQYVIDVPPTIFHLFGLGADLSASEGFAGTLKTRVSLQAVTLQ